MFSEKKLEQKPSQVRQTYVPPMVIYESQISTRAGSPLSNQSSIEDIDPAELFDE